MRNGKRVMKKKSVIFVDDEPFNLKALKRLFRNEDFEFIVFDSPIKALSVIDKLSPEVVISDQCMPEMAGIDFLEEVRKKHPNSVRIILTGHADLEMVIGALNKGHIFRFIQKPWDDDKLKTQVRAALEHQASCMSLRNIVDHLADDIIDNKRMQKNMSRFTESVADELRQPLMVMGGYIQLLQHHIKDDEIFETYLSNIKVQVETMEKLAEKIKSVPQKLASPKDNH